MNKSINSTKLSQSGVGTGKNQNQNAVDYANHANEKTTILDPQSTNTENINYDVFICHSSKDNEFVKKIINKFNRNGITYWVDAERIQFGDSITQKIEDGLKRSKCVMPCLSRNLARSGWTRAEYGSFLNAEFSGNSSRKIIPIKLDDCEENDIPPLLRDKKRVMHDDEKEFAQFLEFLKNKIFF